MASIFYTLGEGENQQVLPGGDNKIKIYNSLSQLKSDIQNLRENQIVATIEDEYSETAFDEIDERLSALEKEERPKVFNLTIPDSNRDYKLRLTFKKQYQPVFVSYMRSTSGYQPSKPDPFVVFTSGGAVKTIPNDVQSDFEKEADYIFTLTFSKSSSYPTAMQLVTVTEVAPETLVNAEIVEA